ncbi:MAG: nucleoside deaminase [Chryseobacterium sp.]|nr:MAG: nucleoside deaminase [Chryseobacterium sp.]
MFTDEYFMRLALGQAQEAFERDEIPVGCVVVYTDRIVAKSHNLTELLNDVTAHAEMQAITAAAEFLGGKYLRGCTLYVTLEPCVMCAGALAWSQVSRVVIGARDEQRGFINKNLKLHPKTELTLGVLADECRQLMLDFFKAKR